MHGIVYYNGVFYMSNYMRVSWLFHGEKVFSFLLDMRKPQMEILRLIPSNKLEHKRDTINV